MLLESEVLELYKKITVVVRVKLNAHLDGSVGRKYNGVEIYKTFGFPSNRQSEIKDPEKYPESVVSQPLLKKLLGGGFVTVKEIKATVNLNEEEREYLDGLSIYENKGIHNALVALKKSGIPEDQIEAALLKLIP